MKKSKCCGQNPEITRMGDILMISDKHDPKPHPHCMTCGLSCEVIEVEPVTPPTTKSLTVDNEPKS